MLDLLLEKDSGPRTPEVFGFHTVEVMGEARWRWAIGERQRMRFRALPGESAVRFQIYFPFSRASLRIFVAGTERVELHSRKDQELLTGAFDLGSAAEEREVSVEFLFSADRDRDYPRTEDGSVLSYSVECFQVFGAEAEGENFRERIAAMKDPNDLPATFCALPFLQMYVDELGQMYPCCESRDQIVFNERQGLTALRLQDAETAERAWNGDLLRRMRRQMLSGIRPRACTKCFSLEDQGASSLRQQIGDEFSGQAWDRLSLLDAEGSLPKSPSYLDVRLGNHCNLRCRMCKPSSSVALADEFTELYGRDFSEFKKVDWYRSDRILSLLAEKGAEASDLMIAGGEPFVIPEFAKLLRLLIDGGHAGKIHLRLISNGTQLPRQTLELFPKFRKVSICFSLDGYAEVNEYVRFPSCFSRIDENLRLLHERGEEFNVRSVTFNTTVQAYNLLGLPDLLRYLARFPRFSWLPNLSLLAYPGAFSVWVLPPEERARAKELLRGFLAEEKRAWVAQPKETGEISFGDLKKSVEGVLEYLEGPDHSHLLPEFRRLTQLMDEKRSRARFRIPGL